MPNARQRVASQRVRRRLDPLRKECLSTGRVQLQLLRTFGQRPEVLEQDVPRITRPLKVSVRSPDEYPIDDRSQHDHRRQHDQGRGRKPPEIDRAARDDRNVCGEGRKVLGGPAEHRHVVGQRREDSRDPDALELPERRRKQLAAEVEGESRERFLGELIEEQASGRVGEHSTDQEATEPEREPPRRRP